LAEARQKLQEKLTGRLMGLKTNLTKKYLPKQALSHAKATPLGTSRIQWGKFNPKLEYQ